MRFFRSLFRRIPLSRLKRIRFQMRICVRGSELLLSPARTLLSVQQCLPNAKRRPSNARSSLSRTTSPSSPTYISKDGGPYRYVQHRDPQRSRVQGQGHGHGRLRVRTPARAIAGKIANVAIATPPLRRLSPATASTPSRDQPWGSTVRMCWLHARIRTMDARPREFSPILPSLDASFRR